VDQPQGVTSSSLSMTQGLNRRLMQVRCLLHAWEARPTARCGWVLQVRAGWRHGRRGQLGSTGGDVHQLGHRVSRVLSDYLPRWQASDTGAAEAACFDRYDAPMSEEQEAPKPEVPRQHRYDYGGSCWWCGAVADSREHKYKRTDLARIFGPGPYVGDAAVVRGVAGLSLQVQGPKSGEVKFPPVLCATCNNARSQPFDSAYDAFTEFITQQETPILQTRRFRFSEVYGAEWRSAKENLAKYYVKHIGCRLADAGIRVERPMLDYLDGRSHRLSGLQMRFGIQGGILALAGHMRSHGDSFGGGYGWAILYACTAPRLAPSAR
jgi:hypothetical protein